MEVFMRRLRAPWSGLGWLVAWYAVALGNPGTAEAQDVPIAGQAWLGAPSRRFDSGGVDEAVGFRVLPQSHETVLAVIGTDPGGARTLRVTKLQADGTAVFPTASQPGLGRLDARGGQIVKSAGLEVDAAGSIYVAGMSESLEVRDGEPTPFVAKFDAGGRQLFFETYVPADPAEAGDDLHHYAATAEALLSLGDSMIVVGSVSIRKGDQFGYGNHVYVTRFDTRDMTPVNEGFYRPGDVDVYITNKVETFAHDVRRALLTPAGHLLVVLKAGFSATPEVDYLMHVRGYGYRQDGSAEAFRFPFEPVAVVAKEGGVPIPDPEYTHPVIPSATVHVLGAAGQYAKRSLYGPGSSRQPDPNDPKSSSPESVYGPMEEPMLQIPGEPGGAIVGAAAVPDGIAVAFTGKPTASGSVALGGALLEGGQLRNPDWLLTGLLPGAQGLVPTSPVVLTRDPRQGFAVILQASPESPFGFAYGWVVAAWDHPGRRFSWAYADASGFRGADSTPVGIGVGADGITRFGGTVGAGTGQDAQVVAVRGMAATDDVGRTPMNTPFRWSGPGMLADDGVPLADLRSGSTEVVVPSSGSGLVCTVLTGSDGTVDPVLGRVCGENLDLFEGLRLIRAERAEGTWWIGVPGTGVPDERVGSLVFEPKPGYLGRATLLYSLVPRATGVAGPVHRMHVDVVASFGLRWLETESGRCLEVPALADPVYLERSNDLVDWRAIARFPSSASAQRYCLPADGAGVRFFRAVKPAD